MLNLIAYTPKDWHSFLFVSFSRCRVIKRPVQPQAHPRKNRAFFFGTAANGYEISEMNLSGVIHQLLGVMSAHIDPRLFHHLEGQGMDAFRLKSSTENLKILPRMMA